MPRKNVEKQDQTAPKLPAYRRHKPSGQAVVTLSGKDHYLGPYGSPKSRQQYKGLVGQWLMAGCKRLEKVDAPERMVPGYRRHKASGKAVVTLSGKDFYLGVYGSPESKEQYQAVVSRWLAAGRKLVDDAPQAGLPVNGVLRRYLDHAEAYYVGRDGKPDTRQLWHVRRAVRAVRQLYGLEPVASFGPKKLVLVREHLVGAGFARVSVNRYMGIIKRAFKWAAAEEIAPAAVWQSLAAVEGLRRGRTPAHECEPVKPVPEAHVDALEGKVSAPVWAMIQLQRHTGMRPGEVVIMRACDLDTTGDVWIYKPAHHKTEHHGHTRQVALGPKAQAVLKPFLKAETTAYLFDPRDSRAAYEAKRRAARKTSLHRGNRPGTNRRARPERKPRERYTVGSYGRAIVRGCDLAWPAPAPLCRGPEEKRVDYEKRLTAEQKQELAEWRRAHQWHPNQLRHTHATIVRKTYGLDAAATVLGHAKANITELYAEKDAQLASKVALAIG